MSKVATFCFFILCFAAPNVATAEEREESSGFYPNLDMSVMYDSNIQNVESDIKAGTFITINPSLLYLALFGKHRFSTSFNGNYGFYQEYDDENFSDSSLNLDMRLDLTKKLNVNLEGKYTDSHELRGGEGTRSILSIEPDQFNESRFWAEAVWGRRTSRAQVAFSADFMEREYTNNHQEGRTRERITAKLDFYYNLGPKTSLLAEVRHAVIDYTKPTTLSLDSNETYLFIGARWRATTKTRGTIKVGYQTKNMDEETLSDYEGFSTEGKLIWERKSYSRVLVVISRTTRETPQYGTSYYVSNSFLGGIEHDFSRRLTVGSNFNIRKDVFSNDRDDDLFDAGLVITYSALRWLDSSLQYNYTSRSSTQEGIDYTSNVFMLKLLAKVY